MISRKLTKKVFRPEEITAICVVIMALKMRQFVSSFNCISQELNLLTESVRGIREEIKPLSELARQILERKH